MTRSKEIKKDVEKYKSLEVLADSDGGKILIETLNKDVINTVDWLASNFTEVNHTELIARCAVLKSSLATLRTLKNSKKNVELAEDALKEALSTDE